MLFSTVSTRLALRLDALSSKAPPIVLWAARTITRSLPLPQSVDSLKLAPLTPEYIESEHGAYVAAIEEAMSDPRVHNIAVSGSYGAGKSSILHHIARRNRKRVVELSMATLTPTRTYVSDMPAQANTPTNRIQQEIVKQLLYREAPKRMPGSRFRRIGRFSKTREVLLSVFVGLVVAIVFALTGWTDVLVARVEIAERFTAWSDAGIAAFAAVSAFVFRAYSYGRFSIKEVSAGAATITLGDKSASYFDQYLDEIVYFFEVSKRNIVILEDLDRFNDSHIFEALRSLNTLLNASPQIRRRIVFIYAMKDSIFDQLQLAKEGRKGDAASPESDAHTRSDAKTRDHPRSEAVRANRTKFFDIVIPVVPFITHRSARNLSTELLRDLEQEIDPGLIDVASRHVPDMRLLKNVRNEFIVFRDRIRSGDGSALDLRDTELFAMMLYKSTHLADFEAIRLGSSKLDEIYSHGRALVSENIARLEREAHEVEQRIKNGGGGLERAAAALGKKLLEQFRWILRATGSSSQTLQYVFEGQVREQDYFATVDFWQAFVKPEGDPKIVVQRDPSYYGHGNKNITVTLTRSDLEERIGPFDLSHASTRAIIELKGKRRRIAGDRDFLRNADIADLVRRSDLTVAADGSAKSLDQIARELLGSGLGYELVRCGYVNRNFTLYTATFHGTLVGAAAMNYIIHHVERGKGDPHFQLSAGDVDAVVRESGEASLADPALYNIHILDRLLEDGGSKRAASIMVAALAGYQADQKRFLCAYLLGGANQEALLQQFTPICSGVLELLVSDAELSDSSRIDLLSTAFQSLDETLEYEASEAVASFLEAHYGAIPALIDASLAVPSPEQVAKVFSDCGVRAENLLALSSRVRPAFAALSLYTISRENLGAAVGSTSRLALDQIKESASAVYAYVVVNLDQYIKAIDGSSSSVASEDAFIDVLEDVVRLDDGVIDSIVRLASEACTVQDIGDVSHLTWEALCKYRRFPPTLRNVQAYTAEMGLDANLSRMLARSEKITDHASYSEAEKAALALRVLMADEIPAAVRAKIVEGLELEHYVDPGKFKPGSGEFLALLVEADIVSDDASAYAQLSAMAWPHREAYIRHSEKFPSYMSPELVGSDLAALMNSKEVQPSVKSEVLEQAEVYASRAGSEGLVALAEFAIERGHHLPVQVVQQLANGGAPAELVLKVLQPLLGRASKQEISSIAEALGGEYARASDVGAERPKLPHSSETVALLKALQGHGIVSKFTVIGDEILVHKRRK